MTDKHKLLSEIELFVLDMDGTFYLGENMIEGSLDFIQKVKDTGLCVYEGAGHFAFAEQPARTIAIFDSFLS